MKLSAAWSVYMEIYQNMPLHAVVLFCKQKVGKFRAAVFGIRKEREKQREIITRCWASARTLTTQL